MQRRVLMVYDRFPPFNVSGSARAFHFAKRLPEAGWTPVVLSSPPPPGLPMDEAPLRALPLDVKVLRAQRLLGPRKDQLAYWINRRRSRGEQSMARPTPGSTLDARRVFRPNSWAWRAAGLPLWLTEWYLDWTPAALARALSAPEARSVDLVWVSSPNVRNLPVADTLSRVLKRPLVVDLRDPWTYGSLWRPRGEWVAELERATARRLLGRAARVVVTSPLTEQEMQRRFPNARFVTITNGFSHDETLVALRDSAPEKCLFRYVGVLNDRRTPDTLLQGLALACHDPALRAQVRFEFVGEMGGHQSKIAEHGLSDVVSVRGPVPHQESLRLMRGSDINVILQTIEEGQDVIAGKTFEYLAARKPILAVVAETGGDAWLLRQVGGGEVAPYQDPERIAQGIRACFERFQHGQRVLTAQALAAFERGALAKKLAALFDEVISEQLHGQATRD